MSFSLICMILYFTLIHVCIVYFLEKGFMTENTVLFTALSPLHRIVTVGHIPGAPLVFDTPQEVSKLPIMHFKKRTERKGS